MGMFFIGMAVGFVVGGLAMLFALAMCNAGKEADNAREESER